MERLGKLVRIRQASIVEDHIVRLEFEDDSVKKIDLKPLMHGPIFDEVLENPDLFHQMMIGGGTIAWPNGADIDPDVLYYGLIPAGISETDPAR